MRLLPLLLAALPVPFVQLTAQAPTREEIATFDCARDRSVDGSMDVCGREKLTA